MDLAFHPLAEIFPLMQGPEFDELVADIKTNGLREPIVLFEDKILDGRNRYRACQEAGVHPFAETYEGADPAAYVISLNIHRRHFTTSQRALLVADFARFAIGDVKTQRIVNAELKNGVGFPTPPVLTTQEAGNLAGVHRDMVQRAKIVLTKGTPEDIEAVRSGKIGVNRIAERIRKEEKEAAPKKPRKLASAKNQDRVERSKFDASIWQSLSGAIDGLCSLPLPADVVSIVLSNPKRMSTLQAKLSTATLWLMEFEDAWNRRRDEAEAA